MIITDLSAYMNMWNVHTCISGYKIRGVGVCDFFQLIKILLKFYFLNPLYTASQTERSFLFNLSKVTGGE